MKIARHFQATVTSDDTVRYQAGIRKWWRALFYQQGDELRLSRQAFKSAREAKEYKRRVLERLR